MTDPIAFTLRCSLVCVVLALLAGCGATRPGTDAEPPAGFVFTYFTGNGEDGLHLAYSRDGLTWLPLNGGRSLLKPTAGGDRLMRDPSIVQGPDGRFHMVWTVSWGERAIGYAHSDDLIHWSEQRTVPVMEHEPAALNTWAPELFYDAATDRFFIVWSSTIPGRFPDTDGQGRRSDDRPGYNHRMYLTTTRDFVEFTPTRLFYDHGFSVIDGAIVRDDDRYVLVLKNETDEPYTPEKNLRVAFADKAEGPYGAPSGPITGDYWAEGPAPLRVGDRWMIYFDKYRRHAYGVVTTTDWRHFEDWSDRLTVPEGMRHGTAFPVSDAVLEGLLDLE